MASQSQPGQTPVLQRNERGFPEFGKSHLSQQLQVWLD